MVKTKILLKTDLKQMIIEKKHFNKYDNYYQQKKDTDDFIKRY